MLQDDLQQLQKGLQKDNDDILRMLLDSSYDIDNLCRPVKCCIYDHPLVYVHSLHQQCNFLIFGSFLTLHNALIAVAF